MAKGLVFRILKEEELHNLCSDNKGADHLCGPVRTCAFDFAYAKGKFSHDAAHLRTVVFKIPGPGHFCSSKFFFVSR